MYFLFGTIMYSAGLLVLAKLDLSSGPSRAAAFIIAILGAGLMGIEIFTIHNSEGEDDTDGR